MFKLVLTVICLTISSVELAKRRPTNLPSYIPKCTLDNTFNDCFVKTGNDVIPKILDGDKKFNVPSFRPFKLDKVVFAPTPDLKMDLTNLKITGFDDAKLLNAKLDQANSKVNFELSIPHLVIKGDYETKGRILVLPFEGNGPVTVELVGGTYKCVIKFENFAKDSQGKLKVIETSVDYTLTRTIYNFENLFNGNARIGDETNKFLNENHKELNKDFKEPFSKVIETIAESVINGILENIHTTDVFNFPE